jgi:hypothetical protein
MEQLTRYRIAADRLLAGLDNIVNDIDPEIHQTALGRYLIAKTLIDKAAAVLLEDSDCTTAHELVLRAVTDRFANTHESNGGRAS